MQQHLVEEVLKDLSKWFPEISKETHKPMATPFGVYNLSAYFQKN